MDVLKALALVENDETDKPKIDIIIHDTIVYLNPFSKEELEKDQQEEKVKQNKEKEKQEFGQWLSNPQPQQSNPTDTGIGKYLSKSSTSATAQKRQIDFGEITQQVTQNASSNRKKQKTSYGDFSHFGESENQ